MGKIQTQKQAKLLMIHKLNQIARDACIARENCKKFYSQALTIQHDITSLADKAIALRNIISSQFSE